jgi:RND family efflux transporter MFP subunit
MKMNMTKNKTIIASLVILFIGGAVTTVIFMTEPVAKQETATIETAMLVDVIRVQKGDYYPLIITTGTVEPEQDIVLSPLVGGEIIGKSPAFTPGGFVKKGEVLFRIEPADYEIALEMKQSDLHQANADFELEMGRQKIAELDYKLLEESLALESDALVLREPQLNVVKARVEAAEAAVRQARLELERTVIRAPFDAQVLSRNVNIGSQVSPGDDLGRLAGTDFYWAMVTIPLSNLEWLTFAKGSNKGSEVRIRNRTSWKEGEYRTGYLNSLIGELDDQTRLARALVSIPDPLAQNGGSKNLPPLMIGEFVEAVITGKMIPDVIRLNRDFIRKYAMVWVMEDGKLSFKDVDIVFRDAEHAYIADGLDFNDLVITTSLSTVVEGVSLRTENFPDPFPELEMDVDDFQEQN